MAKVKLVVKHTYIVETLVRIHNGGSIPRTKTYEDALKFLIFMEAVTPDHNTTEKGDKWVTELTKVEIP